MKKSVISTILALCIAMCMGMLCVSAREIASGSCGENLTWSLDNAGALTIRGVGEMVNFIDDTATWDTYKNSITSIEISDTVTSIGARAFVSYSKLKGVNLGKGIKTINNGAFQQCDTLEKIEFPEGLLTIDFDAFYGCDMLKEANIPNSVITIGSSAFRYCYALEKVSIGSGVEEIGSWAFSQGLALEEISVNPQNKYFTSDENGVLYNKNKTEIVQYPVGSKSTTFTIDSNIASIREMAFAGCTNITEFIADKSNENYMCDEGVIFNKSKTELIQYPAGNNRVSYTVPNSVTYIGITSFFNCGDISKVVIHKEVKNVDALAFYKCSSLKNVVVHSKNAAYKGNIFSGCHDDLTIYGHTGSTAETFASNNNIHFEELVLEAGDINGSGGEPDIEDVTIIAEYIIGLLDKVLDTQIETTDLNDDGEINIKDLITLMQNIAGNNP